MAIHLIADGLISLAGWTHLWSRSPGWLFACAVCAGGGGEDVILKLPAPQMNTDVRVTQLCIRTTQPLMLEMAAQWDKHGNNRKCRPKGIPMVYDSKLGNCLFPISPFFIFFWLAVFSLLQSFLSFTVWFIHQTFNQMCSLHKQLFWL